MVVRARELENRTRTATAPRWSWWVFRVLCWRGLNTAYLERTLTSVVCASAALPRYGSNLRGRNRRRAPYGAAAEGTSHRDARERDSGSSL